MLETVLISISCAVSVLAMSGAVVALKAADPIRLRRLVADLGNFETETRDAIQHIRENEFERLETRCENLLERAELKLDASERKRKSVAAREQQLDRAGPAGDGPDLWADESLPRDERQRALSAHIRGLRG